MIAPHVYEKAIARRVQGSVCFTRRVAEGHLSEVGLKKVTIYTCWLKP
jgi:hypothetical protein